MSRVKITFPEQAVFEYEVAVRITDLNYGNHLGHDSLVSLLHEARAQFFRSLGGEESDTDGRAMMIADLAVRYKTEAFFGQYLRIEIAIDGHTRRSCDLVYRVSNIETDAVVALAKTGIVFFDRSSRALAPLPETLARAITGD